MIGRNEGRKEKGGERDSNLWESGWRENQELLCGMPPEEQQGCCWFDSSSGHSNTLLKDVVNKDGGGEWRESRNPELHLLVNYYVLGMCIVRERKKGQKRWR